jgi:hypothetical protein
VKKAFPRAKQEARGVRKYAKRLKSKDVRRQGRISCDLQLGDVDEEVE